MIGVNIHTGNSIAVDVVHNKLAFYCFYSRILAEYSKIFETEYFINTS